jgi:hypothetical protein
MKQISQEYMTRISLSAAGVVIPQVSNTVAAPLGGINQNDG